MDRAGGLHALMMVMDQPGTLVVQWTEARQTRPALWWVPDDDAYPPAWWRPDTLRLRRDAEGFLLLCAPMRPGAQLAWVMPPGVTTHVLQASTRLNVEQPQQRVLFHRPPTHRPPGLPGGAVA